MKEIDQPILSTEALADLGETLRRAGFKIATQQCVWAQQLLLRLALEGRLPNEPAGFVPHLSPIFCCSPEQQRQFPGLFEQWCDGRAGPAGPTARTKRDTPRGLR